jgi:hypothetical protein
MGRRMKLIRFFPACFHGHGGVLRAALVVCAAVLLSATPCICGEAGHDLCEVCGRCWAASPSRMRCQLVLERHISNIQVCSPFCLCERIERYSGRDYELRGLQIIDYSTLDKDPVRWAEVQHATFLVGINGDVKDAGEPLVAAFARVKVAQQAQEELGGKIQSWDELYKQCVKLAADFEPKTPHNGRNPSRRPNKR